jgi:hypothetical protein
MNTPYTKLLRWWQLKCDAYGQSPHIHAMRPAPFPAALGVCLTDRRRTGAIGTWRSETEFLLDVNIANINHYTLAIRFLPDGTIEARLTRRGDSRALASRARLRRGYGGQPSPLSTAKVGAG